MLLEDNFPHLFLAGTGAFFMFVQRGFRGMGCKNP
jgi:hypothetical protein